MIRLTAFALLLALGAALVPALSSSTEAATPVDGPVLELVDVRSVDRPLVLDNGELLRLDREVVLHGSGFFGTSFGPFVDFVESDGTRHAAVLVVLEDAGRVRAAPPPGLRGPVTVELTNPDRESARIETGL